MKKFEHFAIRSLIILWGLMLSARVYSYPEMTRLGYFSCSSCHVSPAGGGLLTPYGQAISAEKLSTWSKPSEGLFGHGLGAKKDAEGTPFLPWQPSWLLIGGNIRYMQLETQRDDLRMSRWLRMQSDLSLGIILPNAALVLTGGPRGETRARPDLSGKLSWRSYYFKYDIQDYSLRAGRFYPRFGLGLAQHQVFVRRSLGFDQGQENRNLEFSWVSERHEITLTGMFGALPQEKDGSAEKGFTSAWSYHLFEKHRLGLQLLSGDDGARKRSLIGVFGSFALGSRAFFLAEEYFQNVKPNADKEISQFVFYHRLGYELFRGFIPSLIFEGILPDFSEQKSRREIAGLGLQWFPRPHFELDAVLGSGFDYSTGTSSKSAYVIGHYYL